MKGKFFATLLFLLAGFTLMAQTRITGVVSDDVGPLVGVSVIERGTNNGTITGDDGSFALTVRPGAVIVFSSIGYEDQVISIGNQTQFIVTMKEDSELLEETVVVGYGTQKKSDITGSVASVDTEQMMQRAPISIAQGLQGAAAGVVITQSSGDPTGGMSIRIRGVATMNGDTNPLWVVDGVQYGTSSNLSWLDPQDVENIEILKDASATAIYGSRGANGVILVTTKKGSAGKIRVDFKTNVGISTYADRLDMASLAEYLPVYRQSVAIDGRVPFEAFNGQYDSQLHEIDWQDVMTQTAVRQQYNLSISGGSESMRTNLSIGYMDNKGIVVNSWNKRMTLRLNTDFNVTKWLRAGLSMNFNTSKGNGGGNMINYARTMPTMDYVENGKLVNVPVVYDDGTYGHFWFDPNVEMSGGMYAQNPYAAQTYKTFGKDYDSDSGSLRNAAYIEVTFMKGLTFRSNLNYDFSGSNSWDYTPGIILTQYDYNQKKGQATDSFSTSGSASTNMGAENYLTFDREFGQHHLTAMVGQSASMTHGSWNNSGTKDLTFPFLRGFFSTNGADYDSGGGAPNISTRFASYFGRLNYVYGGRYMLTATVRRDGSSNFGKSRRWGTFPSFSLAWRISEEPFIKDLGIFDNLKLRLGWGETGNANVSPTASVPQLSTSGNNFDTFDQNGKYTQNVGISQNSEIDPGLHWETSVQKNVGLDLGVLNNSLTFSVDYYVRDTRDLILGKAIRPSAGFTSITTNFGSIMNSGWEFAAGYKKQLNSDWFISASVTGSTNKNKAVDIGSGTWVNGGDGANWDMRQVCFNGLPLGTYYGYRVDHIIQDQAEIDRLNAIAVEKYGPGSYYDKRETGPGDFLFKDLNGDGRIDTEDRDYLGDGFPALNFGINLTASYKNWDASLYGYGVLGQEVLSWAKCYLTTLRNENNGYFNLLRDAANHSWSETNRDAKYPRVSRLDMAWNTRVSDFYVEKADYFKLSNLTVGYTFTKKALNNALNSLRLSLTVQNLLTMSPYKMYGDPEISGGVTTTGYDGGRYPFPRTFMFGLQLGL